MENVAIYGEAIAGRQLAVRRTLIKLTEDLSKHTFDAAELLYEVQKNKYYLQWNYESLGQYAAAELNLKERKAQYLSRIVMVCTVCGLKRTDYELAGLTNLRTICTLDPETSFFDPETKQHTPMAELITDLIASAPELSTVEVEQEVKRLKGQTGENAMVTKSYSVTLSAYENVIKPCFESVRKRLGSAGRDGTGAAREYTDGNCVEAICAEYNADPRNFLEESDESHEQIEVPLEETNDHTPDQEGTGSTEALPNSGRNVRDNGLGCAGDTHQVGAVDSSEVPQDTFQESLQPFRVPTD